MPSLVAAVSALGACLKLRTVGHMSLSPRDQLILHLANRSTSRPKDRPVTAGPGSSP